MTKETANTLANLLSTLLANPDGEKPRLNPHLKKDKVASDIQFVMNMLKGAA